MPTASTPTPTDTPSATDTPADTPTAPRRRRRRRPTPPSRPTPPPLTRTAAPTHTPTPWRLPPPIYLPPLGEHHVWLRPPRGLRRPARRPIPSEWGEIIALQYRARTGITFPQGGFVRRPKRGTHSPDLAFYNATSDAQLEHNPGPLVIALADMTMRELRLRVD
ncbi:MAG: hypothetical protein U0470_04080 [Anaerolineae bacterium]